MKKHILLSLVLLLAGGSLCAQPALVKKAAKSVFALTTYKADSTILATSHGVFIDNNGTALSPFAPFVGAARATVTSADGATFDVDYILGGNELYDYCKFHIDARTTGTPLAMTAPKPGSEVWLLAYGDKAPTGKALKVRDVEKFDTQYNYYIFEGLAPDDAAGCPVLNGAGLVMGLLHQNANGAYAADANFGNSLKVNGLTTLDPALRRTRIRTALPDVEKDAEMTLALAQTRFGSGVMRKYAQEFIQKFPASTVGYKQLADLCLAEGDFAGADEAMRQSIERSTEKDVAHSNYADIIYRKLSYMADKPFEPWSADKGLEEAEAAIRMNPSPVYRHQKAQLLYLKGDYQQACDLFVSLGTSDMKTGEVYYEAAQCKAHLKAPREEILKLLDLAVANSPKNQLGAPYFLARGRMLDAMGRYRDAIADYNVYDSVTTTYRGSASPEFYYTRYKCEKNAHQWQPALNDIAHAALLDRTNPTYLAELAALELRVGRYDDAVMAATRCTELAADYADGWLILGMARLQQGKKQEAAEPLEKAKALGDTRAEEYLHQLK